MGEEPLKCSMILAESVINLDDQLLKTLAWTFTILSGAISIALSIHRFGLSPGKRIATIAGVLVFGFLVALLLISPYSPFRHIGFISKDQVQDIQDAHNKAGNQSSGYEMNDDGELTENPAETEVNRISEFIYVVVHPDGKISGVYNGSFFDAVLGGQTVSCELIDIGGDRVLIIWGDQLETIELGSAQEDTTFKVQKVPVTRDT